MSARRPSAILLSLLLAATGCARLFPATNPDEPLARTAQPRVEKAPSRRREGADVTLPKENDPNWVLRMVMPCERADSAAKGPAPGDCRRVGDQKVDTLGAPIDTAAKKRP